MACLPISCKCMQLQWRFVYVQAMARYVRREVNCLSITGIHYFTFSLNELSVHQVSLNSDKIYSLCLFCHERERVFVMPN